MEAKGVVLQYNSVWTRLGLSTLRARLGFLCAHPDGANPWSFSRLASAADSGYLKLILEAASNFL